MSNNEPNVRAIKASSDNRCYMLEYDGYYIFSVIGEDEKSDLIKTPSGQLLKTSYIELADRILDDLECYGNDYHASESIIPWHATMIDNFSRMDHSEVEAILDQSFLQKEDWTLDIYNEEEWWDELFGEEDTRIEIIKDWLSKCTHMQMTAACCIGNAYESLNLAFVMALLMENYEGAKRDHKFKQLASYIDENYLYSEEDVYTDCKNFELYYGIHLEEEGPIINMTINNEDETNKYIGAEVSFETLVGRNYYLFTSGEKEKEQPIELELTDLNLNLEEEDDEAIDDAFDDDEGEELKFYVPEKCWIKRISAIEDGNEAYYIVALALDEDSKIENITILLEEVTQMGGGFFFIPGMDLGSSSEYTELDYLPGVIIKELDLLIAGRALAKSFSFIGKRLPQKIIDQGGNGGSLVDYTYALQSAYRLAYMHMSIYTTEEGVIENFSYSSYQSTGSSYGDMFSRPRCINDRKDEAIDMLLYILDQYTEEEYSTL